MIPQWKEFYDKTGLLKLKRNVILTTYGSYNNDLKWKGSIKSYYLFFLIIVLFVTSIFNNPLTMYRKIKTTCGEKKSVKDTFEKD